jgi:hypothetical protein
MPGPDDVIVRKVVDVPKVEPGVIVIDGRMDEAAWQGAAHADLITSEGYEIWANKYYREALTEPEFDELYGRMLWADDTLYVFVHIDEIVNDSTNLFFAGRTFTGEKWGHWSGDQLFIGVSNRLGIESWDNWEGNPWMAPDGPYHLMIMGDQVTFNDSVEVWTPEEFRCPVTDTFKVYTPDFIRSGVRIDTTTGVWDVELAIYNPNVKAGASVGFNIGGSTGSRQAKAKFNDAYGYYVWQPNVPDDPWAAPTPENWNSYYIQRDSQYWALLRFALGPVGVAEARTGPVRFALSQNYPNPFNPVTNIRFQVTKTSPVTLKVYNVLGQEVATLLQNRVLAPGTYQVTWDAKQLPSGTYLYSLESGGLRETRKMVLAR